MSGEHVWNDISREEIRETLRFTIRGEVRLAKRDHEDIVELCREVHIQEECPEHEWDEFNQFASDEVNRATAQHAADRVSWPGETDCDRLDRVEATLRNQGILLWQASPCCDTCTGSELPDRVDMIESRHPGFRKLARGYAFFIEQNLPAMLADNTVLSIFLAYGWFSPDGSPMTSEVYKENALRIAREVCHCLRGEGFDVDWNGDIACKIGASLNWQRRTMLE